MKCSVKLLKGKIQVSLNRKNIAIAEPELTEGDGLGSGFKAGREDASPERCKRIHHGAPSGQSRGGASKDMAIRGLEASHPRDGTQGVQEAGAAPRPGVRPGS